jgi:hypothetical protein
MASSSHFSIQLDRGLAGLTDADIVIVPSWRDIDGGSPAVLLDALVTATRGALLVRLRIKSAMASRCLKSRSKLLNICGAFGKALSNTGLNEGRLNAVVIKLA